MKTEAGMKWWKLRSEKCCTEELRQGGGEALPDEHESTAEVIGKIAKKVFSVSSGERKEDNETWRWDDEVQESIQ